MDILLCSYPLWLTYEYYSLQTTNNLDKIDVNSRLSFLVAWWATFGTLGIAENYAGISAFPFYTLLKGGVMVSMYSKSYRDWITQNALSGALVGTEKVKSIGLSIINEHSPQFNTYINYKKEDVKKGWFSGWFN